MKIAKVTTFYGEYLERFYLAHPDASENSYASQKAALDFDAFGWADYWSNALKPLGYDSLEITANASALQHAWANENGIAITGDMKHIVLEQLRKFKPDVLFMADYSSFPLSWLEKVRHSCPSIKLVIGWCGAPYSDRTVFKGYDLVLSCIPELVDHFNNLGHRCEHINHAFDARINSRIGVRSEFRYPFSFVGQIVKTMGFHAEREKLLMALGGKVPLEIFSSAADVSFVDDFKSIAKGALYDLGQVLQSLNLEKGQIRNLPILGKHLGSSERPERAKTGIPKKRLQPAVFGLEMFKTLRDSTVTLNQHINASKESASNMRLFEATGVGTCLLTDWKPNLSAIFEPESEVVTYKSADECVEKARWLLANPAKAELIGAAGRRRTLSDHTFSNRAVIFDDLVRKQLK